MWGVDPLLRNPEGWVRTLCLRPQRWVRGAGPSNPWTQPSPGVPTSLAVLEELLALP